ncbi:M1 family aminopeptidase [Hymenobacter tenuis]
MRFIVYSFLLALLLAGLSTAAQVPGPAVSVSDLNASMAEARAHIKQAKAARTAYASLSHRQKMARYDVSFYKLDLNLSNTSRGISGMARMKARTLAQGIDSFAFELHSAFTIDSVVVNGKRSPGWRRKGLGDITAGLKQSVGPNMWFDALVYYRGIAPGSTVTANGAAFNSMPDPTYGVRTIWSLSEPYNAYEWWPCKQVLTDKADSSEVWVSTSSTNKVGSNGVLERVTTLPDGRKRHEWKSRYPIDYYLISVAIAPYVEYVNYAQPAGGPRIPIVNYVYSQAALNFFKAEIDRTPPLIEYFSELVGLYPFAKEKYGHSMAPIGGGMEHQTMTTQTSFSLTLTAHELFHQWFGDNVTCGAWEDIWLNEGFASYAEYLALDKLTAHETAQGWMKTAHYYAMNRYENSQWKPMTGGSVWVPDTTNPDRIFDYYLTYKKAASVVHMLRYELNDDAKFFRALRTYQDTYRGKTARTRDMQRILEAEAGRSLQYFFDQWIRGQGYPIFATRWNQVGSTLYISTTETASMPTITPFFETDIDYQLQFIDGSTRTVRVRQGKPVTSFSLPEARIIARVTRDPEEWLLSGAASSIMHDVALVTSSQAGAKLPVLTVYPNPCREQLRVVDFSGTRAEAEVTDATGRVVLRQTVLASSPVLATSALAPGLYHLRLTESTGRVAMARFVRAEE